MKGSLSEKALLVTLHISAWTARKYDKTASDKTAEIFKASEAAGRYNKLLIAKEAIKAVEQLIGAARTYHYTHTLPWSDNNSRLLACSLYFDYTKAMREYESQIMSAVDDLINGYDDLKREAKSRLGRLHDPADYPDKKDIRKKYEFFYEFSPLPTADDIRVNLGDDEISRIRRDLEEHAERRLREAMQDAWQRTYDAVSHMAERLAKPGKIFRDSLVGNLTDLCKLLPAFNLSGDSKMETMRQEIERKLCSKPANVLRDDNKARKEAHEDAKAILSAMAGYMGGAK